MATTIDQQTRRRTTRVGLTALDKDLACPGYVLYPPNFLGGIMNLIDLEGNLVHQWNLPYAPAFWGYLLPNGNLFYLGKDPDAKIDLWPGWAIEQGGILMEVDWDGTVIWEHRDPYQHHDGRRTEAGGAIYLTVERMPEDVAAQVQGGVPDTNEHGMVADVIVEVNAAGERIWEWHAHEHLDFETDILPPNVPRHEWSHANTVVPLAEGRVLVSFRHISTIAIIDKASGDITWKLGHDLLSGQHDASMLANGNILVFDNGPLRKAEWRMYSRVIEIDPGTNDIVWKYEDKPFSNFFSWRISGARRLPNGNTLITEGEYGRMFQVTPDNEVVWEYINPHFHEDVEGGSGTWNAVFRATHYMDYEVPIMGPRSAPNLSASA